jgi:hypothetical protein
MLGDFWEAACGAPLLSVPLLKLHGDMLQPQRTASFLRFNQVGRETPTAKSLLFSHLPPRLPPPPSPCMRTFVTLSLLLSPLSAAGQVCCAHLHRRRRKRARLSRRVHHCAVRRPGGSGGVSVCGMAGGWKERRERGRVVSEGRGGEDKGEKYREERTGEGG